MKRLLLVGLVLLLAVGLVSAGERMTKQGTYSLNFTFQGLGDFNVGPSPAGWNQGQNQYGFGGSYFLNDDMALRAGVAFSRSNTNAKYTGGEVDDTEMGFGFYPALLWYCTGDGPVAAYWGPTVFFSQYSHEIANSPVLASDYKDTWTGFGAGIVMGAQWWAWDQVAFNAEYMVSYSSFTSKHESGSTSTDNPSDTEFGIGQWSLGLGLFFNR
jgi:hypothetical protein